MKNKENSLRDFYILWSTQGLSQLGSSMTAFALTLWLYQKTGSALSTAALTICTYAPYVLMSIFAGALTDRLNKKKTMLVCDLLAALCTLAVFMLYRTQQLAVWHLYAVNAVSGLMNTVQQPASEVTLTLIVPKEQYQKVSGLNNLSRSLISVLNPLIASAVYAAAGLETVIAIDLFSFLTAFGALAFLIEIDEPGRSHNENALNMIKEGLSFLRKTPMILNLILFLAGVNLISSAFNAALPGYVIPNPKGGTGVYGIMTSASGAAMVLGSLLVTMMPKPKDRVRAVFVTMAVSLGSENYILAFSREPFIWVIAQIIGWILVPVMSTNLEVILRNEIPVELQGRVYACRNTLQFFTIPVGLFCGGWMVDQVCEPFMKNHGESEILKMLFGTGKGSGAAMMMFILGIAGTLLCILMGNRLKKYHYHEQ